MVIFMVNNDSDGKQFLKSGKDIKGDEDKLETSGFRVKI